MWRFWMIFMLNDLETAKARRMELLEIIAQCADEIATIDRCLPILYSLALEEDLLRAEEHALA
jgi:hypothetical protein